MAVAVDAAVASIGNDHDVKLKYTVELRALNIQHMKNTLMVQVCAFLDPQITKFQVFVFRYSGSVVRYGHSCLGIQAQYSGLCLGTHIQYSYSGSQIQVFRFRYSGLEFRFGYTGLSIQVS